MMMTKTDLIAGSGESEPLLLDASHFGAVTSKCGSGQPAEGPGPSGCLRRELDETQLVLERANRKQAKNRLIR